MKNLIKLFLDNYFLIFLVGIICLFFYPVFISGKIPLPADTIVGMYHPWRDKIWDSFTAGVPYKNFLTTDPVRQQYVWRKLAVNQLKASNLPLWNPYSFSGTPLLANFQTAAFYPLNALFFILPFNLVWTLMIMLQPILGGIFLYFYLRNRDISKIGSFLGAVSFAFCGFSVAWLEWNTVVQTVIWLPLILLAKEKLLGKITFGWVFVLIFAEISQFFAGHLQVWFYSFLISNIYLIIRIGQITKITERKRNYWRNYFQRYLPFIMVGLVIISITAIQWLPTLQFILHSTRNFDQGSYLGEGWFIPWQNLVQFLVPDFFGNPATNNYWGIWNYGEFIGFIGFIPLFLAVYSLIFRKDKKTLFFGLLLLAGILFAFPTPIARLPFILKIPFISTSQPTRLMYIIDFSLCILSALGFDRFLKDKNLKKIIVTLIPFSLIYIFLWILVTRPSLFSLSLSSANLLIAKHNLIFPTAIFIISIMLIIFLSEVKNNLRKIILTIFMLVIVGELLRFGWKFTPFTKKEWIYPSTKTLEILDNDKDLYRILAVDRRIMPPNFSVAYKLEDVSGYDPLYLENYGKLVAAWERNTPDIRPASFNRIVTPTRYDSFLTDLLGIKYLLSLTPLQGDKLKLISQEGETYLYLNKNAFPRVFLAESVVKAKDDQDVIDKMFNLGHNLRNTAVVTENINIQTNKLGNDEKVEIISYAPDSLRIQVKADTVRLLVLTDIYYPSWKASIDGKAVDIIQTDFALRGVLIPEGNHTIEFKNNLL